MEQEKLMEVLKDKAFTEKIVKLQTPEEVQAAFKEKGIEMSTNDVQLLGSVINKMVEKGTTELSEEDFKEIAGGWDWKFFKEGAGDQAKGLITNFGTIFNPPKTAVDPFTNGPMELTEKQRSQLRAYAAGTSVPIVGVAASTFVAGVGLAVGVPWAYKKVKNAIDSRRNKK